MPAHRYDQGGDGLPRPSPESTSSGADVVAREPVRTYLYAVGVACLLVLNGYGIVADERTALWGNLLAVVFVPAVEAARARVTPVRKHRRSTP
jgi:hypothetical protein